MGAIWPVTIDWLIWLPVAFAVALLFLRHGWAALVTALAPWPGLLLALVVCVLLFGGFLFFGSAYAFGFAVGLLAADTLWREQLSDGGNWRMVAWAGGGAGATSLGVVGDLHDFISSGISWTPAILLMSGTACALWLIPAVWRRLSFDEGFIARANRAAETRARMMEVVGHIAIPRWALSLTGVAMVMAALGWFEIAPHGAPRYISLAILLALMGLLAHDWRAVTASALCAALLWLFRAEEALPFFALPALLLAQTARARMEEGGDAWRMALEEEGAGLLFAALGGVILLALAPGGMSWLAGLEAFAAALIFFPAFVVAFWTILPRRRSVEEMYRG